MNEYRSGQCLLCKWMIMRINKYLSSCGVCSRREADRLVESGRVFLNGIRALPGDQVETGDLVELDGKAISLTEEKIYLRFYKPVGIVCTEEKREKDNLIDYLHYPQRITYAGRLDKNSEGLMLLTNDGDLIQKLMRGRNGHQKEYQVLLDREMTDEDISRMEKGVFLKELNVKTRPCTIKKIGDKKISIVLTQGLNRQIRRMCETFGYRVKTLKRVRLANLGIDGLKPGQYLPLTEAELQGLLEVIKENGQTDI